ncbi:hypothetical protein GCM10009744_41340 [Kribbella alba]|uniref:DUF3618 domain-containing protein n=1 Tax=Kribbella alba TaxID=190197 RepID=A0ABP4RDY0_9ACTN
MKRFSERLSTLSEGAKRAEEIIEAVQAKDRTRPDARRKSNGKHFAGWIMSNGVPALLLGRAVVMHYRQRRNKHHQGHEHHHGHR